MFGRYGRRQTNKRIIDWFRTHNTDSFQWLRAGPPRNNAAPQSFQLSAGNNVQDYNREIQKSLNTRGEIECCWMARDPAGRVFIPSVGGGQKREVLALVQLEECFRDSRCEFVIFALSPYSCAEMALG